jgi:hypothetical protein
MENPQVLSGKTNLLGLGNLVLWALGLATILSLTSPFPALRRQIGIVVVGVLLMILDLIWRTRQVSPNGALRFISDTDGGAVAYLPAWIWMPLLSGIAAAYWLGESVACPAA